MKILRTLWRTLAVLTMGLCLNTAVHAQSKTIKMGSMAWEDLQATSMITKKFLEKQGYAVELTLFSEWGIAFAALQKGDIDLFTAGTDYVASDYWARYRNRLERVSVVYHGLYQGLVVPSYMAVDSVDQLNTVADQVRGRIIGVEPGSGLMRETADAIKGYGLKYQLIDGSTAAMVAQLKSALERREPIVAMLWTPSWMMQAFDVKFLQDPKGIFAPPQAYYWIARKGFFDQDAKAREFVATVHVPLQDIIAMTAAINNGKTIAQAVDAWWDAHQTLIERWSVTSSR